FPLFMTNSQDGLAALQNAIDNNADTSDIKAFAHSLKSMCSSAGAQRSADIANKIEGDAEVGPADAADVAALAKSIDETIEAMQAHLKGNQRQAARA
ncbi:MAG: Hpt domain-containing protein, partial [Pseudomonadota bacterium]